MVSVAIVEDDLTQTKLLKGYLKKCFEETGRQYSVDSFSNGVEFLDTYKAKYDILLLDIEMPIMDGMEVAKRLRKIDSSISIIFVTNMSQFAVNGYEVDAIGFLVKPVSYFGFAMTFKKALRIISSKKSIDLMLNTKNGLKVISSDDLVYIESKKHDLVYFTENEFFQVRGALKDLEQQLEKFYFVRCNNCYLVNLKFVSSVGNTSVKLQHHELAISRSKKKVFVDSFMRYIGGGGVVDISQ